MKNTVKKLIANILMAIVLVTGISTVGFANTTNNADSNNTIASITEEAKAGYFRVGRYRTVLHKQYLRRGDSVAITLNGDGYTNLDIYVYDAYGNLVDYRASGSDYERMTLDIFRSEVFRIKVVNRGNTYNDYRLSVVRY